MSGIFKTQNTVYFAVDQQMDLMTIYQVESSINFHYQSELQFQLAFATIKIPEICNLQEPTGLIDSQFTGFSKVKCSSLNIELEM